MHAPRGQTDNPQTASTGPKRKPPLVLFDLDNTLVDRTEGLRHWAEEFTRERGLDALAVEWIVEADDNGLKPRDRFFAELRDRFAIGDTAEALHHAYQQRYPLLLRCPRHVLDQIAQLREAGWRVGVVTNGLTLTQGAVLEHTGLAECLDGWCISEEANVRKPDPGIFVLAAERCGSDLTAAWMCGDSPEADVVGAQLAGLHTIWIRHGRTWPASNPPPDQTVDSVTEALQALRHMGSPVISR
ncbi:HAD family hydrolase [Streptomyces orinoci]|uniref:HAD family hydrolase n=1 Tax=Streptomyces orinoci TaxID=67339 RepID=A0ABV3K0X9_STRON|nr:HAD family hydrolase [Streptomyces orinoci]